MDASVQEQNGISSSLSGAGEKQRPVKRWFFLLLLLLGGLGQAAGQGDHICNIATVTDCTQNVHQGLTQTERTVDPIVFDSPIDRRELAETLCADSYEEEVTERKDDFRHFQSFHTDVYKVKNLLKLGESVCEIYIDYVAAGTGFVLVDNFILTNAHVLRGHIDKEMMQVDAYVWAIFNYDDPESLTNVYYFSCKETLIDFDEDEDYVILELNPESLNFINKNTKIEVPPGLLKNFGPVPKSGQAFIIGHPGGEEKKLDPTYIIEKKDREQAINNHLRQYKDRLYTAHSIIQHITDQQIKDILTGGTLAEKVVTYKTFMSHGSSGSPVFDALGQVFGLHTAGFNYRFLQKNYYVIDYAHPLLTIFRKFVRNLRETGKNELFRRVKEEAKENKYLEEIMESEMLRSQWGLDINEAL